MSLCGNQAPFEVAISNQAPAIIPTYVWSKDRPFGVVAQGRGKESEVVVLDAPFRHLERRGASAEVLPRRDEGHLDDSNDPVL